MTSIRSSYVAFAKTLHTNTKKHTNSKFTMKQNHLLYITTQGDKLYIKSYNQSLSEATIVAASLIKSSTTLSNIWSTLDRRKSLETKHGEALEHDDWKKYKCQRIRISFKYHEKKGRTNNNLRKFAEVDNSCQTRFLVCSNKFIKFKILKQHVSSAKNHNDKKQNIITKRLY